MEHSKLPPPHFYFDGNFDDPHPANFPMSIPRRKPLRGNRGNSEEGENDQPLTIPGALLRPDEEWWPRIGMEGQGVNDLFHQAQMQVYWEMHGGELRRLFAIFLGELAKDLDRPAQEKLELLPKFYEMLATAMHSTGGGTSTQPGFLLAWANCLLRSGHPEEAQEVLRAFGRGEDAQS